MQEGFTIMKKAAVFSSVALAASALFAQFRPGEGVANDHATGANERDVVFVQRGGVNPYGYRSYDMAIGLTFLPWAVPNFESSVKGLRLNLGWGHYAGSYGIDVGTFSSSGDFGGIAANVFGNAVDGDAAGLQVGLVNIVGGRSAGLQIGLVNYTSRLCGVQIGLLNISTEQWTLPIINAAF